MLTAFIAIIKDSFRAAMASRVLYVLLIIITLVLLVVAPLHTRETLDWKINARRHIQDEVRVAQRIFQGNGADATPAQKRIWERMSDKTRVLIEKVATAEKPDDPQMLDAPDGPGDPIPLRLKLVQGIQDDLNKIFQSDDFYDQQTWDKLTGESKTLADLDPATLTKIQKQRLNRLLVTTELSPALGPADQSSLEIWYGIWQMEFATTSTTRADFNRIFATGVSWIFDKFVMSIGLFIAILVTSSMIPEMFEPGSLNLLLSKPVPRWLLLTGKFVGGCAFISMCAIYLFLGAWLWMGLATGLWDRGLLWSIPLYVVVFAIYFSVSMLVGILYRSAIVSVILTVVFWGVCFGVGATWSVFDSRVQNDRIVSVRKIGETLIAADCQQRIWSWDQPRRRWMETVGREFAMPQQEIAIGIAQFLAAFPTQYVYGPVVSTDGNWLLVGTPTMFDPEQRGGQRQVQAVPTGASGTTIMLGTLPNDVVGMIQTLSGPAIVSSSGAFSILDEEKLQARLELPATDSGGKKQTRLAAELFVPAGPDKPQPVRNAKRVAVHPESGDVLVMNRNQLARFHWDAETKKFLRTGEAELLSGSAGRSTEGWLAVGGKIAAAAWGTGKIVLVDLDSLQELETAVSKRSVGILDLQLTPDGQILLVLFRDGQLFTFHRDGDTRLRQLPVKFQGQIEGFDFAGPDQLLICHSVNQVSSFNLSDNKTVSLASPRGNFIHNLYRYVINPFYVLAPKPGEFYKLVTHLSATADAVTDKEIDLTEVPYSRSPWSPLWSGLLFMGAMLGLGCVIFARRDY